MIQYDSISIKIVYLMTQNPPQPRLPSSFIAPANLQLGSLAQFDGQCVSHLRLEPRFFGFTSFGGRLVDADATPNLVCLGALVPGSKASFQGGIASRTPGKRLVRNLTKNVIKSGKFLNRQANRSEKKTLICSTHSTKSPVNKPCMQHTKGSISSTGVSPFQDFVRQGRIIVFLPCQEVKFQRAEVET